MDAAELAALRQEVFDAELMNMVEAMVELVQARSDFLTGEHGDESDAFERLWSRFARLLYERHLHWKIDPVRGGRNAVVNLDTGEFEIVDMLKPDDVARAGAFPGAHKAFVLATGRIVALRPRAATAPTVPD